MLGGGPDDSAALRIARRVQAKKRLGLACCKVGESYWFATVVSRCSRSRCGRMPKHNMTVAPPERFANMEHFEMSGQNGSGKASDRHAPRHSGVSLFRPGQMIVQRPVASDQHAGSALVSSHLMLPRITPSRVWESLSPVTLDARLLVGNGLFTNTKSSPAAAAFDMLRTRILQALQQRGWKRLAVTSPTHGCGKSFVAANLAFSLARMAEIRTVLMDLELRNPGLAPLLGVDHAGALSDFLTGDQPLEHHFRRVGRNLALALNGEVANDAAELLHDGATAEALEAMLEQLDPDVVIYDMPPALGNDDVTMMLPQVDAVLLVADGTQTTADDVRACERLFEGRIPLMGVVLNRSQDRKQQRYRYGKK